MFNQEKPQQLTLSDILEEIGEELLVENKLNREDTHRDPGVLSLAPSADLAPNAPERLSEPSYGPPRRLPRAWDHSQIEGSLRPSKTALQKTIDWSSSKFNEHKKHEVIQEIQARLATGELGVWKFSTGSYSQRGHLGGWDWTLHISEGGRFLVRNEDFPSAKIWEVV